MSVYKYLPWNVAFYASHSVGPGGSFSALASAGEGKKLGFMFDGIMNQTDKQHLQISVYLHMLFFIQ